MNDFARVVRARRYIPGRNPALETVALQGGGNVIGDGGVVCGVANKDARRRRTAINCLLFAAAFSHAHPLPTLMSWSQMRPVFIKD